MDVHRNHDVNPEATDVGEIGTAMEVLTRVDLESAYASEKLLNLESLLTHVLSWENGLDATAADDVCIGKLLTVDLLFGVLDSEVKEVDFSMDAIRADLVDACRRLVPRKHVGELFSVVEGKLRDSEDSLKRSREHVLEMKTRLAKLQMTSLAFNHTEHVKVKPRLQTVEKAHVLRMLEKSLSRELDLEKKLTESKLNEDDLRLKLRLTERVAVVMEEAAEMVWARFLEAENAAVVLMGVSKDMVAQNQIVQFNLNRFNHREDGFRSRLEDCVRLLTAKDASIEKLNARITQLVAENLEVLALRSRVKTLEERAEGADRAHGESEAAREGLQARIHEMEAAVEAARARVETEVEAARVRAEAEVEAARARAEAAEGEASGLEERARELEIGVRHARATAEAGQEQQNMLYAAIWDMETLIDELKQKVSRAEDQCGLLTKEVEFLRAEVESLETSLSRADNQKMANAKDIGVKAGRIMDMVVQIAAERERITKQLNSQTKEKRTSTEASQVINTDVCTTTRPQGHVRDQDSGFSDTEPPRNPPPKSSKAGNPASATDLTLVEIKF